RAHANGGRRVVIDAPAVLQRLIECCCIFLDADDAFEVVGSFAVWLSPRQLDCGRPIWRTQALGNLEQDAPRSRVRALASQISWHDVQSHPGPSGLLSH